METQREFDWTRAEQLSLIRRAEIPSPPAADGKRTSSAVLKGVLRVLDDHGGGRESWLSYDTIAEEACCGVRTAKRAVEILQQLSLIVVQRRRARFGGVCNHYRIVWSELSLLCQERPAAEEVAAPARVLEPVAAASSDGDRGRSERSKTPSEQSATRVDQSATRVDQSATGAKQSATGADQSATGGTRSALKRTEAPPPPTPACSTPAELPIERRLAAAAGSLISKIGSIRGILEAEWARGKAPEDVAAEFARLWAIATHPKNRLKWTTGPANACVYRYRAGSWPANEIVEDVSPAARDDAATAERRRVEAESKRRSSEDCRAMEIVKAGRLVQASDAAIAAALAKAGLAEASERLAWRTEVSPETRGDA